MCGTQRLHVHKLVKRCDDESQSKNEDTLHAEIDDRWIDRVHRIAFSSQHSDDSDFALLPAQKRSQTAIVSGSDPENQAQKKIKCKNHDRTTQGLVLQCKASTDDVQELEKLALAFMCSILPCRAALLYQQEQCAYHARRARQISQETLQCTSFTGCACLGYSDSLPKQIAGPFCIRYSEIRCYRRSEKLTTKFAMPNRISAKLSLTAESWHTINVEMVSRCSHM